jgi:hypothetical protein
VIFSDALNHAYIIVGLRLVERQQEATMFVCKHHDMPQLDFLLYVSVVSYEIAEVRTNTEAKVVFEYSGWPGAWTTSARRSRGGAAPARQISTR